MYITLKKNIYLKIKTYIYQQYFDVYSELPSGATGKC